jgi:predicted transposase/invertase (TIGR01784 family)
MKTKNPNLIRFDWAMKRLLRNKAHYTVLEGFLSVLLGEDVKISNILDGEGNQDSVADKFNRVDILAENTKKELFVIEMQTSSEADYFLRMLYGVSRVITNHMQLGDRYRKARKIFSINIVYFELGHGKDYVYHGNTAFHGLHYDDLLELNARQQQYFGRDKISALYPEYYILKVNDFDNVAKDSLDEWIYYLKNNAIPDEFTARGLSEAREVLQLDSLSENDRQAYIHHVDQMVFERGVLETSRAEGEAKGKAEGLAEGEAKGLAKGKAEGLAEGLAKGKAEGLAKAVEIGRKAGFPVETIAAITGLTPEEINAMLQHRETTYPAN